MAMSSGQFLACWGLLFILILQVLYALPYILSDPVAYIMNAYANNLMRSNDSSQSILWIFPTLLHGSILKFMLFSRLLHCKTMFRDLNVCPLTLFPSF